MLPSTRSIAEGSLRPVRRQPALICTPSRHQSQIWSPGPPFRRQKFVPAAVPAPRERIGVFFHRPSGTSLVSSRESHGGESRFKANLESRGLPGLSGWGPDN